MVKTQLCKLRDTSDTLVGRAYQLVCVGEWWAASLFLVLVLDGDF